MSAFEKVNTTGQAGDLDALIAALNCDSRIKCASARLALVKRGQQAVPPLINALKNGTDMVPMQAAKALGKIGGMQAVQALVTALEDKRSEVRWAAAEALLEIGRDGVQPLLKALVENADSNLVREGAHHVFSEMEDVQMHAFLAPVVAALDDGVPRLEAPLAAKKALDALNA